MRRFSFFLLGLLTAAVFPLPTRAASLAVQCLGLYDAPLRPSDHAERLTDGFAFRFLPEYQFNPFLGCGIGFTSDYLYKPGAGGMRVGTLDLSARLRLPVSEGRPQPYVEASAGINALPRGGNHWGGKNRLALGIGTRLPLGFGVALDLGAQEVFLRPSPDDLQFVSVHAGLVTEFDLKRRRPQSKPSPTAVPTASTTEVPSPAAIPTLSPTPTGTPTALVRVDTPTPTQASPASPTPTHTTTPIGRSGKQEEARSTPSSQRSPTVGSTPSATVVATRVVPAQASPTEIRTTQGTRDDSHERMLDLYERGIEDYKARRFPEAVAHLKAALTLRDAKVEYWYYAEANAMLGAIYHYHIRTPDHLTLARKYYRAALAIDKDTATAKKGLKALGPEAVKGK